MSERRAARFAWVAFGLTACLVPVAVAIGFMDLGTELPASESEESPATILGFAVMVLAFAALGAVLASRQPGNPIGWILCVSALSLQFTQAARAWYIHTIFGDPGSLPVAEPVMWAANWAWVPGFMPLLTLLVLLFPDGRPPTPRWRWVLGLALFAMGMLAVGYAFAPGPLEDYPAVVNPLGVTGALGEAFELFTALGYPFFALAAIASAASLVVRFRRSHGVERQQIKWMAAAAAFVVTSWLLNSFFDQVLDIDLSPLLLPAMLALPAATAVAVLRYRLYDLDLLINRTLVYGALTATLVASYLAIVLLLQLALNPLTEESDLAIAGSTLAVAALFRPARARIQAIVDRRFYRRRYDASRTIDAFSARLRDQVELEALSFELRSVAHETVQPAHVSLWLR